MGIYNPRPFLTRNDIELLGLLSALILEYEGANPFSNSAHGLVPLTSREAERLLELLEQFSSSKKFVEGAYFVEMISSGEDVYNKDLRNIYLSWRKIQGRSRAMATVHWRRYLNRLGIVSEPSGYLTGGFVIDAEKMEISYFRRMEARLLSATGVSPRVQRIILEFVDARLAEIDSIRSGKSYLKRGVIRGFINGTMNALGNHDSKSLVDAPISVGQLSSVLLIVADISVLFTTRDWDVCGTMSTIAAAAPTAIGYQV